ncbi:serine proteinase [Pseudoflavonifractor sp. HCP28S3_F10]|uniref:serine proteinase n=1 Tax=Pseudoflavonifractor sp. HCP28S3_F10 TaxID=3438947 RepID=UPI003F8C7AB0
MAFFDDLKSKAAELTQVGVAKSKQLAEIAKLNLANSGEEDAIRKAYIEIGKLYYAERGMAPEAAYSALCEKITTAKINIEENKARIAELKEEGSIKDSDVESVVVETEVPAEEPTEPAAPVEPHEDCGCCCGCEKDKPQE